MRHSELHKGFSSVLNPVLEGSRLFLNVFDIEDVALTKVKTKASLPTFSFNYQLILNLWQHVSTHLFHHHKTVQKLTCFKGG